MLNAAENNSSFSGSVQGKPYHERVDEAKLELQSITEILELIAGDGEKPIENAIKWLLPKLGNVSEMMDSVSSALVIQIEKGEAQ